MDFNALYIHALYCNLCIPGKYSVHILFNLFYKGPQCTCSTEHRKPKSIKHFTKISNLAITSIKYLIIVFALQFGNYFIESS